MFTMIIDWLIKIIGEKNLESVWILIWLFSLVYNFHNKLCSCLSFTFHWQFSLMSQNRLIMNKLFLCTVIIPVNSGMFKMFKYIMTFIKNLPKNITDFLIIRINSTGVHKCIVPKQLLVCNVFQIKLIGFLK